MADLTAKTRNALPDSDFALPGRRFPIHDLAHARDALARADNATPAEQAEIRAKVHARYPSIDQGAGDNRKRVVAAMMGK